MDEQAQQQQLRQLQWEREAIELPRSPHLLARVYDSISDALAALTSVLEIRDTYTYGHCRRVASLAFQLAKQLGMSELACHEIYLTGLIHDIGKVGLPDAVLHKPGSLTDEEFRQVQLHPELGHRIVERIPHLRFALPGILHHHEQWDGSGYQHHLRGSTIPMMARVLAVADSFDAMTSKRSYREPLSVDEAVGRLVAGRGIQWEKGIVDQLLLCLEHQQSDKLELVPGQATESEHDSVYFASINNLCRAVAALSH